jgi:integrase
MTFKVTLRQKPISKGRKSLYLDIYPPIPHPETGEPTRREFLGLYVFIDPANPILKQHNQETLAIGDSIRQQRENFLNKPEIYTKYEKEQLRKKEQGERDFIEYFKKQARKRKTSANETWLSALKYLEAFTNGSIKFADLNTEFLEDFKGYLLSTKSTRSDKATLSNNTAAVYFNKVKAALRQAQKEGILETDLNGKVEAIKERETRRNHLTLEELNRLVQTPCNNPLIKLAALFSALTGLRFSDIAKLTWGEVEFKKGIGYQLNFTQQKTTGVETHPISEQAYQLLGEPGERKAKVFEGLTYSAFHNKHLYQWIGAAGIEKEITFHCFRHTYAVLQLEEGTDIYTVSKLLGHKEVKTTQIYAKIVDKTKRTASEKIKLNMK